jgi:hypothetical protein
MLHNFKCITGDYIYGEAMKVNYPMKLRKIRTEVRDSQGGLVALDSDNYIFYKIISNTQYMSDHIHEYESERKYQNV